MKTEISQYIRNEEHYEKTSMADSHGTWLQCIDDRMWRCQ